MEIDLNGGSLKRVRGTISRSQNGTLIEGIKTITAYATDVSGNTAEIMIMMTYEVLIISIGVLTSGQSAR